MWWGRHSSGARWNGAFWMIILIVIGVTMMSGRGWGWGWWMLFPLFFFILPMLGRYMNPDHDRNHDDGDEKPKNDFEKPKRYVTREDGERLEVIDEEDAPLRRKNSDDIEYV